MTKRFASGNEAVIDAALAAGCHFFAGYPVTPATEILEAAAEKFPANDRVMVPTEGEVAAIHMVAGASLAGFRAMTATAPLGIEPDVGGIVVLLGHDGAAGRRRGAATVGSRRRQPRAGAGRLQPGDPIVRPRRFQDDRARPEERSGAGRSHHRRLRRSPISTSCSCWCSAISCWRSPASST